MNDAWRKKTDEEVAETLKGLGWVCPECRTSDNVISHGRQKICQECGSTWESSAGE